jgi:hypothetical protein
MPDEEKGTNRMGDLKMAYDEQITKIFLGSLQLKSSICIMEKALNKKKTRTKIKIFKVIVLIVP